VSEEPVVLSEKAISHTYVVATVCLGAANCFMATRADMTPIHATKMQVNPDAIEAASDGSFIATIGATPMSKANQYRLRQRNPTRSPTETEARGERMNW
jgi:hypothetical protein